MKRSLITLPTMVVVLLLGSAGATRAQKRPQELEAGLEKARGKARLVLLAELVEAYRESAAEKAVEGAAEKAVAYGEEALVLLRATPDPAIEVAVLAALSHARVRLDLYQAALADALRCRALARQPGLFPAYVLCTYRASVARWYLADYEVALAAAREARHGYERLADREGLAKALTVEGVIYRSLGAYDKGLACYFQALEIAESRGDRKGAGGARNNIGLIYWNLDEHERALTFLREASAIFRDLGQRHRYANTLNNIGLVHMELEAPEQALDYYLESLELKQELGLRRSSANTYGNIGSAYKELGDYERALTYYADALAIEEDVGDLRGLAESLQSMGSIYNELEQYETAIDNLDRALAIFIKIKMKAGQRDAQEDLAEAYAGQGDFERALEAHRAFKEIYDDLFSAENSERIAETEAQYETERKEKQIEILKRDSAIQDLQLARQKIQQRALVTGVLLLGGLILLLLSRYRLNVQASRVIARKNERLERVAAALGDSEQRYRRLFENPATPKLLIDPEMATLVDVNASACRLFDLESDAATERPITALAIPWLAEIVRRSDATEGEEEGVNAIERWENTEGEVRDLEIWGSRLALQQRRLILVTMRDTTELRRLEEARLRADKLESVGLLAGGIAHDFNNFLTGILGNLSLCQLQLDEGHEAQEMLRAAEGAVNQAMHLTGQLLAFAKGGEPVRQVRRLDPLIRDAANLVLSGSKVRSDLDISAKLWPAAVDEGQIGQVISNLIINADQAMPGGGTVLVRAQNFMKKSGSNPQELVPGPYVKISVSDHGAGIPVDIREKIFDPYFTTKKKGNGLGLATAYAIVTRHQGIIRLGTVEGMAATFEVLLPAVPGEVIVDAEVAKGVPIGSGRVLVMEDNVMLHSFYRQALQKLGYEPALVLDGEAAIEAYEEARRQEQPFAAVIIDLTIPGGIGGKETILTLRQRDPGVRAVVASGYSEDPVLANYGAAGFLGALPKPFTISALARVLADALEAPLPAAAVETMHAADGEAVGPAVSGG